MDMPVSLKKFFKSMSPKELEAFARDVDMTDVYSFQDEFLAELMVVNPDLDWNSIIVGTDIAEICDLAGIPVDRYIDFDAEIDERVSEVYDDED